MTISDPEDQAERRRVGGLLHESAELGMRGWGAKIPQRRPSRNCNVRYSPESGHWNSVAKCPLCAKSGHSRAAVSVP